MKGISKLTELRPVIIVDTREQLPLSFTRLQSIRGTLNTGDYSAVGIEDHFTVEKKTIDELPGIFTSDRDRFSRECCRLRGYRFKRLLIVGTRQDIEAGRYRSKITPKAILNSLSAFECRHDLPVVWMATPEEAAKQVESWVYWFSRELVEDVNDLLRGHRRHDTTTAG